MKPWEAFFDKNVFRKFQYIYLPTEKGLTENEIKKYVNNFRVQISNLNAQRNIEEMKSANGLHAFEIGMQNYFAILSLSNDPNRGAFVKKMLTDYVEFLHKLEELKCIMLDVSSSTSKTYPIEEYQRYSEECPRRRNEGHYTLLFPDGTTKELRTLEALIEVAKMVDYSIIRRNEIKYDNRPILLDKHFPELDAYYKEVPGTNYWVLYKAGAKTKQLISSLLTCVPIEQRPQLISI